MSSDDRIASGGTDLIDVGEVPTNFDDEFTAEKREGKKVEADTDVDLGAPTIAELKDRFAAFFIDAAILYVVYWLISIPFRLIAIGTAAGPVPASGLNGLIFHLIFLLVAFLWFVIFEFAVGASVGKLACHLTVRKHDGAPLTFGSALMRNLIRPFDLLLAPLLIPIACMEWTAWHRRLGDLAAGTLVIRTLSRPPRRFALSLDLVSSASRRAIAFSIDLVFLGALVFGYALLLSPGQPIGSMILMVLAPHVILGYFAIPEWLVHTSPGKWIMGIVVCHEDGTASSLSTSVVRNLWRPFDLNPWGFFTCVLNVRKQRPGDAAAGSLVIKASREWHGAIALAVVLIITAIMTYAGLLNRQSFLHSGFEVNFLPAIDLRRGAPSVEEVKETSFGMKEFAFAAGDARSIRKPSIFQPGETLYMVFDVGGYKVINGQVWIQEDVDVKYPDGTLGLKLENINDVKQKTEKGGVVRFENNIALPEHSLPGRYTVTITLRDKNAKRELKEQRFFYITPPEETGPTPPPSPSAQPPAPAAPQSGAGPQPESQTATPQAQPPAPQPVSPPPPPSPAPGPSAPPAPPQGQPPDLSESQQAE